MPPNLGPASRALNAWKSHVQELHLVGFTTDLEQLIFSVRKGAKSGGYTVNLDEQLLTVIAEAVRMRRAVGAEVGDAAATVEAAVREGAATETRVESALSPREIQARLRAGRSVKQVARAAGVSEEWVERFAAPVRGEQSQIVTRARSMVFSKPRLGDSAEPLGLSVRWNVAEKGLRFTEQEFDEHWSAYQFQDHVWVIGFTFESRKREQVAEWILDLEANELTHRNRLASDLGYLEPGKRRKIQDLVPDPTEVKAASATEADSDAGSERRGSRSSSKVAASGRTSKASAARRSPAKRKPATKRSATKKSAAKKAGARKTAAKKSATKKTAAKKSAAKKSAAKKSAAKKAGAKKAGAKKAGANKTGAKKSAAKKSAAKKSAAEKSAAEKSGARKAVARASTPPAAAPAAADAESSPWRPLTAGRTLPPSPPVRPSGPAAARPSPPQPAPDAGGQTGRPAVAQPGRVDRTARRAARRSDRDERTPPAAETAPAAPVEGPAVERSAAAGDATGPGPAAEQASPPGQVVTIRANRATPPLAQRPDDQRRDRAAGEDVEEGIVGEPRPLRPAMQARPPRRRRYGNRT